MFEGIQDVIEALLQAFDLVLGNWRKLFPVCACLLFQFGSFLKINGLFRLVSQGGDVCLKLFTDIGAGYQVGGLFLFTFFEIGFTGFKRSFAQLTELQPELIVVI